MNGAGKWLAAAAGLMGMAVAAPASAATNWDHFAFTGVTHPITIYLKDFADEVKKRTNGELVITVRPSGELPFKATEAVKVAGDGLVQLASGNALFISGAVPMAAISGQPMLIRTFDDLAKAWPIIDKYSSKEFAKQGVKTLFHFSWPAQSLYGAGKPIRTLEDFAGRKLRTTDVKQTEMLRRLGAASVSLTTAEVPVAMERGVMEGMFTAAFNVLGAKWYEFTKWAWLGDIHVGGPDYTLVNLAAYNKLPAKVRATLDEVAKEWSAKMLKELEEIEAKDRATLHAKHGVELFQPPKEQLDQLTDKMKDYWVSWAEQLGPDGVAMMTEVRAALGK